MLHRPLGHSANGSKHPGNGSNTEALGHSATDTRPRHSANTLKKQTRRPARRHGKTEAERKQIHSAMRGGARWPIWGARPSHSAKVTRPSNGQVMCLACITEAKRKQNGSTRHTRTHSDSALGTHGTLGTLGTGTLGVRSWEGAWKHNQNGSGTEANSLGNSILSIWSRAVPSSDSA